MEYTQMSNSDLLAEYEKLCTEYASYKEAGLSLDLSRGKPCTEQLDLSNGMLEFSLDKEDYIGEGGFDYRNYGVLTGIPEIKRIFADALGLDASNIIIGGNSSLNLMFDAVARYFLFGKLGATPWSKYEKIKFICPVPGYDRHFKILESFGIEMLCVDILSDGPDMDKVEELALSDENVKGLICVPKYSNPTGVTFSDETVERLCKMKTAAEDFTIIWDNAYAVHDFTDTPDKLANVFEVAKKYGTENRILYFTSTSKITYPGAGVSLICAAKAVYDEIVSLMGTQTIGHDKLNQVRHVKFLKDVNGLFDMMKKQAGIVRPHFEIAQKALEEGLGGLGIAQWHTPNGGYFISLNTLDDTASEIFRYMKEAGVTLTNVGATYPHGKDPHDSNLRLAPTYPSLSELEKAMQILVCTVKLVSAKKLLAM